MLFEVHQNVRPGNTLFALATAEHDFVNYAFCPDALDSVLPLAHALVVSYEMFL